MQPKESPGYLPFFFVMTLYSKHYLLPIYFIYILFPDFQIQVYQLSLFKNNSMVYEDLRPQNGRIR